MAQVHMLLDDAKMMLAGARHNHEKPTGPPRSYAGHRQGRLGARVRRGRGHAALQIDAEVTGARRRRRVGPPIAGGTAGVPLARGPRQGESIPAKAESCCPVAVGKTRDRSYMR